MKYIRDPILKNIDLDLIREHEFSANKNQTVSAIKPMIKGISNGKWKYVFTFNFNKSLEIATNDFDFWKTGKVIESKIYPYLGNHPKHLFCLKFETTQQGQLHAHGLLGGDISIDEINFKSILKSLIFKIESLGITHELHVKSVHFEKFDQCFKKDWIGYMFKNPDFNQRGNTMYYISRRVSNLIRRNNEYIRKIESDKILMNSIDPSRVSRFGSMLSKKFRRQDYFTNMLNQFKGK
jgi:hypothetical protein